MIGLYRRFVDEDAATATEYAVMLALIIIVSMLAISEVGRKVSELFAYISRTLPDPG
jgi:pilus assembly protein Flp/PilA